MITYTVYMHIPESQIKISNLVNQYVSRPRYTMNWKSLKIHNMTPIRLHSDICYEEKPWGAVVFSNSIFILLNHNKRRFLSARRTLPRTMSSDQMHIHFALIFTCKNGRFFHALHQILPPVMKGARYDPLSSRRRKNRVHNTSCSDNHQGMHGKIV